MNCRKIPSPFYFLYYSEEYYLLKTLVFILPKLPLVSLRFFFGKKKLPSTSKHEES